MSTNRDLVLIIAIALLLSCSEFSGGVSAEDRLMDFFGPVEAKDHAPGYIEYVEMGCWQCHGFQGQGGSSGPRLAPDPIPFEAFRNIVRQPYNVMPAYSPSVLTDEKLKRLHEYLQSIPASPGVFDIPLLSED
jgi:hypothetical protein